MKKQKYYVVWKGTTPGIYQTWEDCRAQVQGVAGAMYKSFKSEAEAKEAFAEMPTDYYRKGKGTPTSSSSKPRRRKGEVDNPPSWRNDTVLPLPPEVEARAWAVDAACSGNPGQMEYRGVDLQTGAEVFHYGPAFGTNNIGEFLAIVHGLALLQKTGERRLIYSDSRNAMLWIKAGTCRTKLPRSARTETLFRLIERAEQWLKKNPDAQSSVLKWQTRQWGEIPADFGRK